LLFEGLALVYSMGELLQLLDPSVGGLLRIDDLADFTVVGQRLLKLL